VNLPFWFEALVMALNSTFGAALARSRATPIFGTLLAGLLVGLGGGIVRDLLLLQEPVAISNPVLIPACLVSGALGALLFSRIVAMPKPLLLLQGIVLGTLVTIGAQKALAFDAPAVSAVCLGVITATFGGLVADVMTGNRATIAKQAHWMASALTCGSIAFVVVSLTIGAWPAVIVSILVSASLRYVSAVRNWPSPRWPGQKSEETAPPPSRQDGT
jgi:uncharacterized membrane protein YeiH